MNYIFVSSHMSDRKQMSWNMTLISLCVGVWLVSGWISLWNRRHYVAQADKNSAK